MLNWFMPKPAPRRPSFDAATEEYLSSIIGSSDPQISRWAKALNDFGYPLEFVNGADANNALELTKVTGRQHGFVPVVMVPGYWNSEEMEPDKRARKALELANAAESTPDFGQAFLASELVQMEDDLEIDPDNPRPELFDQLKSLSLPPAVTGLQIVMHHVVGQGPKLWDKVAIVHVPAHAPDELPLFLDWGGWNAVPSSQVITAVARYWNTTCGAELVAVGPDLLEFAIARKPETPDAALALRREHVLFAPDSYEFDRGELEKAASMLRVANSWVFWWD